MVKSKSDPTSLFHGTAMPRGTGGEGINSHAWLHSVIGSNHTPKPDSCQEFSNGELAYLDGKPNDPRSYWFDQGFQNMRAIHMQHLDMLAMEQHEIHTGRNPFLY